MTLSKKISLWAKKSNTKYWRTQKRGRKKTEVLSNGPRGSEMNYGFKQRNYGWIMKDQLWIHIVYLIVKRSVGPLFDWTLFLLISNLNNHAGVDVFPNQLPGFCDVNGNLWNKVKRNSRLYFLMKASLVVTSRADIDVMHSVAFLSYFWRERISNLLYYVYLKTLRFPFNVLDAGFQLGPVNIS